MKNFNPWEKYLTFRPFCAAACLCTKHISIYLYTHSIHYKVYFLLHPHVIGVLFYYLVCLLAAKNKVLEQ